MLRKWQFELPTQLQFGCGSLGQLGSVVRQFGKTVLLVGYRDQAAQQQIYSRAEQLLVEAGLVVRRFFEIPPDPDAELGAEGARQATEAGVDVVVGVGGGSVIDAAKGIALLAKMDGSLWDYTGANQQSRPVTDALPLVAVPTTAGTGTEVSPIAVFTHHGASSEAGVPLKASISSPAIRPKVALVDPDLAVGSPSGLTAACGADALGHAIESCMSRRANPFSSQLAGHAVALITGNLRQAVANPDDPAPREPLALAATLAGAAFSSAGVTMTHSIAQALGGLLHIPHGVAVAIGTPYNLRYNARPSVEQYCQLARCCGMTGGSPQQQAERFVDSIIELLQSVGLPDRVEVPRDECDELADRLTRNAFESTPVPLQLNPRKIDHAALRDVFAEILKPVSTGPRARIT